MATRFDDYYAVPSDAYSIFYNSVTNSYSERLNGLYIAFLNALNDPVYTFLVFSYVNVKGYINLNLAELNFKDGSPQTSYQLYFMPVSGDVKSLYYDSYALQSNRFHEIIQDPSILSMNVTANRNKVSLTNLIRDGLYRKPGLVQHFTFICTSFQFSANWDQISKFHPHNIELRLRWNIKSKICYFTFVRLLTVSEIDSKLY